MPLVQVQLFTLLVSPMMAPTDHIPQTHSFPCLCFPHLSTHQIFLEDYLIRHSVCVSSNRPSGPLFLLVNLCIIQDSTVVSCPWGGFSESDDLAELNLHDNFKPPYIFSHLVYVSVCLPVRLPYHMGDQKVLKSDLE